MPFAGMSEQRNEAATEAASASAAVQRIEIVGERRRAHDAEFRATLVAESLLPGARVRDVARHHGVCTSLIYRWRRTARSDAGSAPPVRLLAVRIAAPGEAAASTTSAAARSRPAASRRSSLIEIEFAGGVRVRVDGEVSLAALRRVVTALRG